jgi:hypothetical protein
MWEGNMKKVTWAGGRGRIWRVTNNQELRELYKHLDIVADIKKKIF